MPTMEQLQFAQHFPYTKTARRIVELQRLSLDQLPEEVVERAKLMAGHAAKGEKYLLELHSSELLLQEVLAYPIAKILVSFPVDSRLLERFAAMVSESSFSFLGREKNQGEAAAALASELGIEFDFPEGKDFFVSLPLQEYLQIRFNDPLLKLVNQHLASGRVFLDCNRFTRFLREKVFLLVLNSLPVSLDKLPASLKHIAGQLQQFTASAQWKRFQYVFRGKADANAFPQCMASLYSQLLEGKKLPHMARFYLATFLNSIGMPKEQLMELFKNSPDFNQKIAGYQINRIAKQQYTPPSCVKIRAQGYCPNPDCNVRHPLSFYRRQLGQGSRGSGKQGAKE